MLIKLLILLFAFTQLTACTQGNIRSPEQIARARILKAARLLIARDKAMERSSQISPLREGIVAISTAHADKFVKEGITTWVDIANDLEDFSHDYLLNKFSKDIIFVATLLWIAISQADREYSNKSIAICKFALSVNYDSNLNSETIKILSKVPSVRYLIESEFYDGDAIQSFLRRMLVTEYLKADDVTNAEEWLSTANISEEERGQLNNYIYSYKSAKEKINHEHEE